MLNLHIRHILGEALRSDANVPSSTLRFGAQPSLQTALKYEGSDNTGVLESVRLLQPSRLDDRVDFSLSNGPSRTKGTVEGVAQAKISYGAKNNGGVSGSAREHVIMSGRLK